MFIWALPGWFCYFVYHLSVAAWTLPGLGVKFGPSSFFFFFFFLIFFLENEACYYYSSKLAKSACTIWWMSGGISSIQTVRFGSLRVFLANACATLFPWRYTWEYLTNWRAFDKHLTSGRICPCRARDKFVIDRICFVFCVFFFFFGWVLLISLVLVLWLCLNFCYACA